MRYTHVYNYMFHQYCNQYPKIYFFIFILNVYCTKKSPKMFFFINMFILGLSGVKVQYDIQINSKDS